MIVAHHGGELPLVLAAVTAAGTAPALAALVRARLAAAIGRLRRRTPRQ